MKVKVLKSFRDKHTKKRHNVGDIMEVTEERFAEILEKGPLVEKISEETKASTKGRRSGKAESVTE